MNEKPPEDAPLGDVSPYLERPLQTLRQAKQDHDAALLEFVTEDGGLKPKP